jgi:GTPase SAR1 family protein
VEKWVEQIYQNTDIKSPSILVLANKRDLPTSQKKLSAKAMENFQREQQCADLSFFEVSARSGYQIEEAFSDLGQRMFEKGQQRKVSGFRITSSVKQVNGGHGSGSMKKMFLLGNSSTLPQHSSR